MSGIFKICFLLLSISYPSFDAAEKNHNAMTTRSKLECLTACSSAPGCTMVSVGIDLSKNIHGVWCTLMSRNDNTATDGSRKRTIYSTRRNSFPMKLVGKEIIAYFFFSKEESTLGEKGRQSCSCRLPGYGIPPPTKDEYLLVGVEDGSHKRLKLSKPANSTNFVDTGLLFLQTENYFYLDFKRCSINFLRSQSKNQDSIETMCFDGKRRRSLVKGDIHALFYDHIQGYVFYMERKSIRISNFKNQLMVYHANSNPKTRLFRTLGGEPDANCFHGNAETRILLCCISSQKTALGERLYSVYALDYVSLEHNYPLASSSYTSPDLNGRMPSGDSWVVETRDNIVHMYSIIKRTEYIISQCLNSNVPNALLGVWKNQILISCKVGEVNIINTDRTPTGSFNLDHLAFVKGNPGGP